MPPPLIDECLDPDPLAEGQLKRADWGHLCLECEQTPAQLKDEQDFPPEVHRDTIIQRHDAHGRAEGSPDVPAGSVSPINRRMRLLVYICRLQP